MKTLFIALLVTLSISALAHESLVHKYHTKEQTFGERKVEVEVVFQTQKWHLNQCGGRDGGKDQGFYIGQREDNDKLMFYCGTAKEIGDTFHITEDVGI